MSLNTSSFVFVGNFHQNPIDESSLFEGKIDRQGRMLTERFVECSYMNDMYQLQSLQDRIALRANTPDIIPPALMGAVKIIIEQLDAARRAVHISRFEMNCFTIIMRDSLPSSGREYCFQLSEKSALENIVAEEIDYSLARVQFTKDKVRYDIQIEPHFHSEGSNLLVGVNAHQNITSGDSLVESLKYTDSFKDYVSGLHRRILPEQGGK